MPYILGIDTGGTNTDCAVLDSVTKELLCSSKSATTKNCLHKGIIHAIDALGLTSNEEISLICLSTTLATNAIVEKKGCKTGIILIGKEPEQKLPSDYCKLITGKLDIRGREKVALSEAEIYQAIKELPPPIESLAVSGFASVRNPSQELKVKSIVQQQTNLPVFCAHQLSDSLGFWERTVTAALNASLIKIIQDFIAETKLALAERKITAPIMIVRSDGTLMTEQVARERPIETILSGPAASILGAKHLTAISDALIVDMGGTTTDFADLQDGKVKLSAEGAKIDGWRTRCRAADISSHGIGGDSKITLKQGSVRIGPQKETPICFSSCNEHNTYLTPTDLAHLEGSLPASNTASAQEILESFSQELGLFSPACLTFLHSEVIKKITFSCVQAAADLDDNDFRFCEEPAAAYLLEKAFSNGSREFLGADLHLQKPVVAVGAPVSAWLPEVLEQLHGTLIIPPHAEVANAIGAASAQFSETAKGLIRPQKETNGYVAFLPEQRIYFSDYQEALVFARNSLRNYLEGKMLQYGIDDCLICIEATPVYTTNFTNSNKKSYVETVIIASACHEPIIG